MRFRASELEPSIDQINDASRRLDQRFGASWPDDLDISNADIPVPHQFRFDEMFLNIMAKLYGESKTDKQQ